MQHGTERYVGMRPERRAATQYPELSNAYKGLEKRALPKWVIANSEVINVAKNDWHV